MLLSAGTSPYREAGLALCPRSGTAHHVHVEVVNLLPTMRARVHRNAKTTVGIGRTALFQSQLRREGHDLAHQWPVRL